MTFNESLMDASSADVAAAVEEDLINIYLTILVGFAGFTVLVYDHLITFADEVQYIWHASKGLLIYLFLINRYLIPLGFIVNLYAYLTNWKPETCARYIRYEGSMVVIGINIVGVMMFLRVRALYNRSLRVIGPVGALLAFELGVNSWLLAHGIPVAHIGPRYPCTMVFESKLNKIAGASAWLPLLYDTVVMALTAYKVYLTRSPGPQFSDQLSQRMLEEGMVYYSVIFSAALTLAIMIPVAPSGIQNISAQLELLLTVAMMSRITIDLKKHAQGRVHYDLSRRAVVDDEEGPYCYQLSQVRFRSIIHGGNNIPKHAGAPHESTSEGGMSDSVEVSDPWEATGDEFHNVMEGSSSV